MSTADQPLTRSQRKHAAILDAAADEFRISGFAATSMDRIAERANVSKRTVYNHFVSKEILFAAILEMLWTRSHEAHDAAYNPAIALEQQLETLGLREMEILTDAKMLGLSRVLIAEAIRSPDLLQEKWSELSQRGKGLTSWIQAAVDDGKLDVNDPMFAAEQFTALLKTFAFWPQVLARQPSPTRAERQRIVESAVKMFLGHYQAAYGNEP